MAQIKHNIAEELLVVGIPTIPTQEPISCSNILIRKMPNFGKVQKAKPSLRGKPFLILVVPIQELCNLALVQ